MSSRRWSGGVDLTCFISHHTLILSFFPPFFSYLHYYFFGLRGLSDFVRSWIGAEFALCDGVRLTLLLITFSHHRYVI